ncbi:MAG: hypothetical protein H8E42_04875 [Nitrospinae bacterium]|nr:hypothetical protein [Nitrospinota bacterium]MBL7019133.1 hypothetical protein [Nitrospinaceae bacterium]
MKNDSKILIPLISFSSSRERWEPGSERGENIFLSDSYTRISPPMELPDLCYGVRIEGACDTPFLPPGCLAVFSKTDGTALGNIYAVGVQAEFPFLGKWLQKETSAGSASGGRKVFMVPTPLHIPGSQTSPIAPSLHHVLLFKDIANSGNLKLVPAGKVLWKHRLVYVQK